MNPLDNNYFTFKLKFNNPSNFGDIEITEPVKFDGATYIVEQRDKSYGRDVSFMNESIDLFFYSGVYDTTSNPLSLPDGTILYNLTMGLEQLLDARKIAGFESDIEFIIIKNGIEFSAGVLDFQESETDNKTFLSCKVIQNTSKQIVKRREDLVVDLFSDKNIDGDPITPIDTENILRKAKPIIQESEWFLPTTVLVQSRYANAINGVSQSDIEDTLSYLLPFFQNGSAFKYIRAANDLTNVEVEIIDVTMSANSLSGGETIQLYYNVALESDYSEATSVLVETINSNTLTNYNKSFTIGEIPRGYVLHIYFFNTGQNLATSIFYSGKIKVKTTSTAINSVIKGCRYIDILKQTAKSISGLDVYAPKFDVDGKYYEQFGVSGNLIKGRDDLPFPVKFKDAFSTLDEVNASYQILDDKIYVAQYSDFYPNREIGVLPEHPDESAMTSFNSRFAINQYEFGYKTYEDDRDEKNTTDSFHTESQWSVPNKRVENTKKIELEQIRDDSVLEKTAKESVKTTTATKEDDKMFLLDVANLSPSTRDGFSYPVLHNIDADGNLQLLNDNFFSWSLIGLIVGSEFLIENTVNAGTYSVVELTDNIITLSGSPASNLESTITAINFPLESVLFTNRTNEGFILIENSLSPNKLSNLRYTIKRNIKEWYNYLATCSKFVKNDVFRNTFFKNNGDLKTQYQDETEPIIENEDVNVVDLGEGILTPNEHVIKLVADWETAVGIFNAINTINKDNTIGGFIRTYDNNGKIIKGYPKKLEYEPATETLKATLEERNEGDYVEINSSTLTVNDVTYQLNTYSFFEINNDYLILFDENYIPIINPTRYDFIKIDGIIYESSDLLSIKLIEIT